MQIDRKNVDDFAKLWILHPPYIPVQVSANPGLCDFINDLKHPIKIEGIEIANSQESADVRPEFKITKSLTNSSPSECLSNSCVGSILITTLF